jgi:hypothetical protein
MKGGKAFGRASNSNEWIAGSSLASSARSRPAAKSEALRDLITVRFCPLCGLTADISRGPRSAITGREQSQQNDPYSITSSARASTVDGTSRPRALAVLRLKVRRSALSLMPMESTQVCG